MSVVRDEVHEGVRCIVCEQLFKPDQIILLMTESPSRLHHECPEGETS